MTGKFGFLYIIVAIVVCVSINIVFSGKVNAADGSSKILVKWYNDSDGGPLLWAKKDKDSDDDSASSDDSSSDDKPSPHKPPKPPKPKKPKKPK